MKQWTKDDLILFYYQELGDVEGQQLNAAIAASGSLKQQYQDVCELLGSISKNDVPAPSKDLNRKIMTNIAEHKARSQSVRPSKPQRQIGLISLVREKLSLLLPSAQWGGVATASVAIAMVMFYMGRMSVEPTEMANQKSAIAAGAGADQYAFDEKVSRRILLTNVSSHLETGQRLLTQVSNSDESSQIDLASRGQMIEEMIAFNRLYRRVAERSDDGTLVSVLEQMETVLLELYHTDEDGIDGNLKGIRSRLDDSDLIFKLKVTHKKLSKQII
jgi:hypothetical protein